MTYPTEADMRRFVDKMQAGYPVSAEEVAQAAEWIRTRLERKARDRYEAERRFERMTELGHV